MGLICKIVGHKWYTLPDGRREGCCCSRCGEYRLGIHNWVKEPGSCEATCSWCGSKEIQHEWNGCTCTVCGEKKDYGHKWEPAPGICYYKCTVCGAINENKENHSWDGCKCTLCGAVRNKDHDFAPSADGMNRCTVCGISIDESRAQSAIEVLKEKRQGNRPDAYDLVRQIEDPKCVKSVAPYLPYFCFERLGELGADEMLAAIASNAHSGYGYELRNEARRYIKDVALRESIKVEMTEEEQRWYDYDIKSGM